ncbi:MAG: flavodoxin domain-containing protein [Eubacteriales bacterium]|nr:flavodoxin domain-containing protein [Eubacteriales bacterium]
MKIIIYGTQYGAAKKYAEELSRRTEIDCVSYEEIEDINIYGTIVYIGSLYAGGVQGMKKTMAKYNAGTDKKLIVVTVGLADPTDKENTDHIKGGVKKQLPAAIFEKATVLHLRGAIDYTKLNFKHKTMMSLLVKKAKNLPEEKKNAEVRALIETYNQVVDFVDFESLSSVIDEMK